MSDQQEVWTAVAQLLRAQLTESVWFSTFSEVEPVSALVREHMEGAAQLSVPLVVDVGVGDNWLDAKQ